MRERAYVARTRAEVCRDRRAKDAFKAEADTLFAAVLDLRQRYGRPIREGEDP
jgi:hypothetical protein